MTYTEIYNKIFSSIQEDNFPQENQVWAAKRVTDALWQISLMLNSKQSGDLNNTVSSIKHIVNNRFKK